jgi:hypothetical protein
LLNFPDDEDTPEAAAAAEKVVAKLRAQGWRPPSEGGAAPHVHSVRSGALVAATSTGPPRQHSSSSAGTGANKRQSKQQPATSAAAPAAAAAGGTDTAAAAAEAEQWEQQQQGDDGVDADPNSSIGIDIPDWWPEDEDSNPDWYSDVDESDDAEWDDWETEQQQQGPAQQQQQQKQKQVVKVDSLFFDPFQHSRSDLALAASQAMRLAGEITAACDGVADAAALVNSEYTNP